MIIVKNHILPPGTFRAMTVGPFIFTKEKKLDERTVRHESIHWAQYKELLIVFFLLGYGLSFLWELLRCSIDKSRGTRADGRHRSLRKRAYRSIIFEREAYAHQDENDYLWRRKLWAWTKEKTII